VHRTKVVLTGAAQTGPAASGASTDCRFDDLIVQETGGG